MEKIDFVLWFKIIIGCLFVLLYSVDHFYITNTVYDMNTKLITMDTKLDILERYKMYDKEIKFDSKLEGVYHYDGYYCVWTKNRTFEDINNTDSHERCHELIHKDEKNHFCEVDT